MKLLFSGKKQTGSTIVNSVQKLLITLCVGILSAFQVSAAGTDPLVGDWQAYDEKTGMKRSIVRIKQDKKNGTFSGRVIKRFDIPGANNNKTCTKCPKPFTNQNVVGMTVIWNLKKSESESGTRYPYQGGYVIDPSNGKVYGMKLKVSRNGNTLKGLGYILGMESLNRRQTWIRK